MTNSLFVYSPQEHWNSGTHGAGSVMAVKAVVITGATSGIGLETAKLLAARGYAVIGIGRSKERCAAARKTILAGSPGADVRYKTADLFHQREVLAGKSQYIPGVFNHILALLGRLIPRRIAAAAVYRRWSTVQRKWLQP